MRLVSLEDLLSSRAKDGCADCSDKKLVCPTCLPTEQCQFSIPSNCGECQRAYCAPADPTPTANANSDSSPPSVGAIAGGVIGGVATIAVITYLVWRFCIKTRRQPLEQEPIDEEQDEVVDAEKAFAQRRDQRSSTHTAHSIASTVLTRASNIIQIAYIPGVTNRATPTSPTVLVPPVPPIPIAVSQASTPAGPDDHFFMPGDLRDSTYSALSGYTDRTSYARTSYAPRSSVASTVYGKNAVIVAAQQTGLRAKPEMVSLRTVNSKSSGGSTPPVPSVDYEKYSGLRPPSPSGSTFSVGSTFLNNASAHTAMPVRAQVVRVGSGNSKVVSVGKPKTPEDGSPLRENSTIRESTSETIIEDSPSPDQGPFSDPPARLGHRSHTSLSAVAEDATRRASQRSSNPPQKNRERSPFGDEHATQDSI